jgi:hypothetical protein
MPQLTATSSNGLMSEEELQAAIADADALGETAALPSLDSTESVVVVPVPQAQPSQMESPPEAGDITLRAENDPGAEADNAVDTSSAEEPAQTKQAAQPAPPAPAAPESPPVAAPESTGDRRGLLYRVTDRVLTLVNAPADRLGDKGRQVVGALAVATLVMASAVAILGPRLPQPGDAFSFLREKRAEMDNPVPPPPPPKPSAHAAPKQSPSAGPSAGGHQEAPAAAKPGHH